MIDLPIYDENNWAFISRGTESTEPVITDDETLQLGVYNHHVWKQAVDTTKKYNIYFYKETIYYDMQIGIGNSNTTTLTRFGGIVLNQSNAGVAGQSINKATIYYDNSRAKWYVIINDNPQYVKELIEHSSTRYITIETTTSNTSTQNRILAITEESFSEENGGGVSLMFRHSLINQQNSTLGFTGWTGSVVSSGSEVPYSVERSVDSETGVLNLGRACNNHGYTFPNGDWICDMEYNIEHDTNAGLTATYAVAISFLNNVDGNFSFLINNDGSVTCKEYVITNGSNTSSNTHNLPAIIDSNTTNVKIRFMRRGNSITFKYVDVNGVLRTVTRDYGSTLQSSGHIYIRTYADWNIELVSWSVNQRSNDLYVTDLGSSNVSNGSFTKTIDTSNMHDGDHIIKAVYSDNCKYNSVSTNSSFKLGLWHTIDCTSGTDFNNALFEQGYVRGDYNGCSAKFSLKNGMTIRGSYVSTGGSDGIGFFYDFQEGTVYAPFFGRASPRFVDFTSQSYYQDIDDGIGTIDFLITISDTGFIRMQDSTGLDITSDDSFYYILDEMHFTFGVTDDDADLIIYLTSLEYKNVYDPTITL